MDRWPWRQRMNGLIAQTACGMWHWDVDPGHPEVSFRSLFLPVWYEGYEKPAHVWQSTGGSDAFEPKFGLWPLVFGTLKATFYSLAHGRAAGPAGGDLHQRIPASAARGRRQADHRNDGQPAERGARFPGGPGAGSVRRERCCRPCWPASSPFPALSCWAPTCGRCCRRSSALRLERWRFLFICASCCRWASLPATLAWPRAGTRCLFQGDSRAGWMARWQARRPGWFLLLLPVCRPGHGPLHGSGRSIRWLPPVGRRLEPAIGTPGRPGQVRRRALVLAAWPGFCWRPAAGRAGLRSAQGIWSAPTFSATPWSSAS